MAKQIMKDVGEHHRRPTSLGGTNNPSNIYNIHPILHNAWHTLFGNMNAYQICNAINCSSCRPKGKTVTCKFINGKPVQLCGEYESKKLTKRTKAWDTLFKDLPFEETIDYINSCWLDPAYHLYIID